MFTSGPYLTSCILQLRSQSEVEAAKKITRYEKMLSEERKKVEEVELNQRAMVSYFLLQLHVQSEFEKDHGLPRDIGVLERKTFNFSLPLALDPNVRKTTLVTTVIVR